jgi:type II secretory pathway component PulK
VRRASSQAGGALLAVLWLSAALSAIVFTLAWTVRGELERASNSLDGARAHFLAHGAVERFLLHLSWGAGADPMGDSRIAFRPGQRRLTWDFPSGVVNLEITGENGKLDIYGTPPAVLARLFLALGVDQDRAGAIAGGIAAMRQTAPTLNLSAGPSFSTSWPSFLQLEDLLKVPGMTPEIFYGWWERDGEGRLVQRGGVGRHLTLLGDSVLNVNYASDAVLRAAGVPEGRIQELLAARESQIIQSLSPGDATAAGSLQLGGGGSSAYTIRATAQLKDRPVRRTATALIRFGRNRREPQLNVVRWYPTAN